MALVFWTNHTAKLGKNLIFVDMFRSKCQVLLIVFPGALIYSEVPAADKTERDATNFLEFTVDGMTDKV